eukprot:746742-Hanusia_phi.AAC.4
MLSRENSNKFEVFRLRGDLKTTGKMVTREEEQGGEGKQLEEQQGEEEEQKEQGTSAKLPSQTR